MGWWLCCRRRKYSRCNRKPQAGFALGGSIDWRFAQQISLGMGLSVGQKDFPHLTISFYPKSNSQIHSKFYSVRNPVWLKYHFPDFKRPWYPFAAAGISVYWPLKERFVYSGLDDVAAFQIANNYNSQSELSSTDNKLLLDITSIKPLTNPYSIFCASKQVLFTHGTKVPK